MTNIQEKRQLIGTNSKMTYMLEWSNKDFKAAIISMLHEVKLNTLETNGKVEILQRWTENIEKLEMLELKNAICEVKIYWMSQ